MAPASGTAKAPCELSFSELNSTAFGLAVYASQGWLPKHHARLASGRWSGATGRAFHPQGSNEKFQSCLLTSHPPFPSLAWRNPENSWRIPFDFWDNANIDRFSHRRRSDNSLFTKPLCFRSGLLPVLGHRVGVKLGCGLFCKCLRESQNRVLLRRGLLSGSTGGPGDRGWTADQNGFTLRGGGRRR